MVDTRRARDVPGGRVRHARRPFPGRHAAAAVGYGVGMSQMGHHRPEQPELEGVPEEENISPADAAERVDEDPEEQENRRDPVWDEDGYED